ncbi:unnamed protein product [Vicia faba]|uniref:PB1-like domain-containing protein n=1 Tax=Vicia faba TaxID=3906 RepID=A0AAV0ZVV8_VICFA|nr:unnamed protein product [Vicia faba]
MDKYIHLKIYHSGEFIDEEFSVYEGGTNDDLEVEVERWNYFELLGRFKELGYREFETIYYMDPIFGINVLVDDKSVLKIVNLYREVGLKEADAKESELKEAKMKEVGANHDNVHEGGDVEDDVSSNDIEGESFNYDSALKITFDN